MSLKHHPLSQLSGLHRNDGTRFRLLVGLLFVLLHAEELFVVNVCDTCVYLRFESGDGGVNNGVDCVNESAWNRSGNETS